MSFLVKPHVLNRHASTSNPRPVLHYCLCSSEARPLTTYTGTIMQFHGEVSINNTEGADELLMFWILSTHEKTTNGLIDIKIKFPQTSVRPVHARFSVETFLHINQTLAATLRPNMTPIVGKAWGEYALTRFVRPDVVNLIKLFRLYSPMHVEIDLEWKLGLASHPQNVMSNLPPSNTLPVCEGCTINDPSLDAHDPDVCPLLFNL